MDLLKSTNKKNYLIHIYKKIIDLKFKKIILPDIDEVTRFADR